MYGTKKALYNINMEIEEGMFGLLGPNGAGKTTLMKILATLLHKDEGIVLYDSTPLENYKKIRQIIGYLPQEFSFYPNFTVLEIMQYLSALAGITISRNSICNLLEQVNLQEQVNTKIKGLSGGMKRRLGIAQALLNNPHILIVDEPTAGLDPEERLRFRNLLEQFSINRTVILSTHIVSDIEMSCKNVAVLKSGELLYNGSLKLLKERALGCIWELNCSKDEYVNAVENAISKDSIISTVNIEDSIKLKIISEEKPHQLSELVEATIEDAYMMLIRQKN